VRRAFAHDLGHGGIQRVLRIRAVEPVISIASAHDQIRRLELYRIILNGSEREKTQSGQLTRVKFLPPRLVNSSRNTSARTAGNNP